MARPNSKSPSPGRLLWSVVSSIVSVFLGSVYAHGPAAQTLSDDAVVPNPVVPGAALGELRHGTYWPEKDVTHVGVDLLVKCGTPIFAFADGEVHDVVDSQSNREFGAGLGYAAIIRHPEWVLGKVSYSLYLHLQEPPRLTKGASVIGGKTEIGKVGQTGFVVGGGCHTHFELRYFETRYNMREGWRNIYGRGARTDLHDWADPVAQFKRYPAGARAQSREGILQALVMNDQAFRSCVAEHGGVDRAISAEFDRARNAPMFLSLESLGDLNGDGAPEVVARGEYPCCLGLRRCASWVVDGAGATPRVLLATGAFESFEIATTVTNGYRDITGVTPPGYASYITVTLAFDGRRYQPLRCVETDMRTRRSTRVKC